MKRSIVVLMILALCACNSQSVDQDRPLKPPKGYMNETFMKISYSLGWLDLIDTEPAIPDEIEVFRNITFKETNSTKLQLDIYKKKGLPEGSPAIIFIHGGAWRSGDRGDYLPYLLDYAKKGYVTITISYRLVKQAKFPAAAQDVNCGINWVFQHAEEYGINPERIALLGGSAGGHLAMLIGYSRKEGLFNEDCEMENSGDIKAIVNFYGPVDLTTPYAISTYQVKDFLNTTYEENPEIFKAASPGTYISSDDPPTITFQGTIDALVPYSQADSLDVWLQRAGVPHDYHLLKGWPHSMDVAKEVNEYCQFYIDRFLEEHL